METTTRSEASDATGAAVAIMDRFAERTGIDDVGPGRRYLWTDAFAVENDLTLFERSGDRRFASRAARLIDRVHAVLGKHRGDDGRDGWLGGRTDEQAAVSPTAAGLRIGKPLPERTAIEPFDDTLEWDRDGQYFHYGIRWVHALAHAATSLDRPEMRRWAAELLLVQHRAFTRGPRGARRMIWKASIDLSRPLVSSMGQHDALAGLVASARLVDELRRAPDDLRLERELVLAMEDFASMIDRGTLATADPLGVGGLFEDAAHLAGVREAPPEIEVADLLEAGVRGVAHVAGSGVLRGSASGRLAFRELGLAIGLDTVLGLSLDPVSHSARTHRALQTAKHLGPLARAITQFWSAAASRVAIERGGHVDIDEVMLAAALLGEARAIRA
jgi:hypothetical protein